MHTPLYCFLYLYPGRCRYLDKIGRTGDIKLVTIGLPFTGLHHQVEVEEFVRLK